MDNYLSSCFHLPVINVLHHGLCKKTRTEICLLDEQ